MEWCLRKNLAGEKCIDGVVTDDPRLFREVCRRWEDGDKVSAALQRKNGEAKETAAWREVMTVMMWMVLIFVFRVGYFWVRRLKGHFDYLEEVRTTRR